jgi:hypothetical protein
VSAVLVTRGDVDLAPIVETLAAFREIVIWDNSREIDQQVFGRYTAIARCSSAVIYVQDDDCVLPAPSIAELLREYQPGAVTANMPERFRPHYPDSCLVGFGAVFDRDLPADAIARFDSFLYAHGRGRPESAHRTCDIIFTTLTPRVLVDVPYTDREFASAPNRMWKQPEHVAERTRMLDLVRKVAA